MRPRPWFIIALIAAAGLLPPALYWVVLGRVPGITPQEARQRLQSARAVIVDVRTPEEFAAGHLDGAVNWPCEQIGAARPLPPELRDRELLVLCASGWRSAWATRRLIEQPASSVYNIRGGLQAWGIDAPSPCPLAFTLHSGGSSPATRPVASFRPAPPLEQWAAVITGFVVKPIYMAGALVLAIALRRQTAADLAALRWAMICFFIGEAFCAINYTWFGERSYLFEYLHSFGMVLTFALTFFAFFEALDRRVIRYSARGQRCAFLALCQRCIKDEEAPCGLRRTFLLVLPVSIVIALAPLCAPMRSTVYTTRIFGSPYTYVHETIHQAYEIRFLPLLAGAFFAASLLVLWVKERHPTPTSRVLFVAGLGALGFSFFRLVLVAPFHDNQVWFATWEEITELVYVASVAAGLWIFRHALFHAPAATPAANASAADG